jgi:hypothetical protein
MLITSNRPLDGEPVFGTGNAGNGTISSLAYRSRSRSAQTSQELTRLVGDSQERNRACGITGQLIYDNQRYFQWLEGPGEHLQQLWESIKRDNRHSDIEVLGNQQIPARFFSGWNLKLTTKFEANEPSGSNPLESSLPSLIKNLVIPQLAAKHAKTPKKKITPPPHRRVKELAGYFVAIDPHLALDVFAEIKSEIEDLNLFYGSVVEPTARNLGDMVHSNECSDFQLTVALVRLQTAVRSIGSISPWKGSPQTGHRAVLVAPQPGELHMLGAVLDDDVLIRAGWQSQLELPASDEAIQKLVSDNWFDALDLNLSVSISRDYWLERLTETIAKARIASCNPELVIVVGGRVFYDKPALGQSVGANFKLKPLSGPKKAKARERSKACLSSNSVDIRFKIIPVIETHILYLR